MLQDVAETIALRGLAWLAGDDELLPVFLSSTGMAAEDLRTRASDADLQLSVLQFITMDDAWVMAFCDANGLTYEQPLQAIQALPGGAQLHWT